MNFGYEDEPGDDDPEPIDVDPTHPASREHCDHLQCERQSDGRLCDECVEIMRAEMPNACPVCGTSLKE